MDYMREINAFYDWAEINKVSPSGILLWHALMYLANKARWPKCLTVPISVLEVRTKLKRSTIYETRSWLSQKGLISFESRDGNQSAIYYINPFCVRLMDAMPNTVPDTTPDAMPNTVPDHIDTTYPTDTSYLTKTKTKTKSMQTPELDDYLAVINTRHFPPSMVACITDWITYKTERRDKYTKTGLSKLLNTFERMTVEHGEVAVIHAVDQSIANGWQGIVWDKARTAPVGVKPSADVNYVSCDDEEV